MSMSTPLNSLPLKTQQTNEDNNDINDPMVQDVLNEFQEELNINRQQKAPEFPQQTQHQNFTPHQGQPTPTYPQQIQQPINIPSKPIIQQNHYPYQNNKYTINYSNNNFPYNYFDIEIIKQTAIIVIIAVLIFYTNIFMVFYDKLPDYIRDLVYKFDIYVRSGVLFIVLYILGFMEYI